MSAATRPRGVRLWPWLAAWLGLVAVLFGMRLAFGLGVPLGPDPAMWGLSASQLQALQAPAAAPAYPALIAVLSAVTGAEPWWVGGVLSTLLGAAIPVVTFALARELGVSAAGAGIAAAVALLAPDLLGFVFQLQPDALTVVGLLGVTFLGLRWEAAPRWQTAAAWVAAALALSLAREHGPLVLVAIVVALLGRRSPWLALGLVMGVAGIGALFIVTGWAEYLPDRVAMPLLESPLGAGRAELPSYANEVGGAAGRRFQEAWRSGDVLGAWLGLLERLIWRSWENLLLIALGAIGFGVSRRLSGGRWISGLVSLAPTLFLLAIWSHRRHTSVLLPVAALGVAVGLTAIVRRRSSLRWPTLAAAVIGCAVVARTTPESILAMAGAARSMRSAHALATWMNGQEGGWFLGGMHNEINLFLRWPRNNPQLPPPGTPMPEVWSGTDWRTMWVAPTGTMPPPYTEVHRDDRLAVFRLEPAQGEARPCAEVAPTSTTLFANRHVTGTSSPPCEGRPHFYPPPTMPDRPWGGQPFVPPEAPGGLR